ncbi:hypothetical protein QEN19_000516 [Hanseniaspora menglaensis]
MFKTSNITSQPLGSNNTGLFGNDGPLQSTPTATNVNSNLPNMFQSVQKTASTTNGGGLFGTKLVSPSPSNNLVFGNTSSSTLKPGLFGGNTTTNMGSLNQSQMNPKPEQGISAYGIQINPLTINITNDIPPSLVDTPKSSRSRKTGNNNALMSSFKNVNQKGKLLLQKQTSILDLDNDKRNQGLIGKVEVGNHVLRKLTINKKKIENLKKLLFESQDTSAKIVDSPIEVSEKNFNLKSEEVCVEKTTEIDDKNISNNSLEVESENSGYWCLPSIKTLSKYSEEQLSKIDNFIIGRENHGSIHFLEPIDLNHLTKPSLKENLFGRIVKFYDVEPIVEVYPDEFKSIKPHIGEGLNVRAVINLQGVEADENLETFIKKLSSYSENEFISYDPFLKHWSFKVRHFSKYGLLSGSSEGHREIYNGKVIKNKQGFSKKETFQNIRVPGFLNDQDVPDYEIVETENNNIKTHTVEVLSVPAKNLFFENEKIIKEMPYEPKNVDIEDLKELINETYLKSFKESNDLLEEMQITNELRNGSIFKKNKLSQKVLQIEQEEQEFIKRRKLGTDVEQDVEMEANINEEKTIMFSSQDLNLINLLKKKSQISLDNENLPVISTINLEFKDLQEHSSFSKLLSLLFDRNEEESKQLTQICDFLNSTLQRKKSLDIQPQKKDIYMEIFENLAFKNIDEAIRLSYETENPQLSVVLSLVGSSKSSNENNLVTLAKLHLETLRNDCTSNSSLILIYKVLANDATLLQSDLVTDWMFKLMALLNYSPLIEGSLKNTILEYIEILKSNVTTENALFKILSLYSQGIPNGNFKTITGEKFFDFLIYHLLNFKNEITVSLDTILLEFIEYGQFENVFDKIFITIFLESPNKKHQILNKILKSNIDLVLNDVSALQNNFSISDDIIYTIQGNYYGEKGNNFKEITAYLKTKKNDALIEKLVLEKTGPYLIFVNKESVLLNIISKMQYISESVNVLRIYAEFKLNGTKDVLLLNELIEKIDSLKTGNQEIILFLYKFAVEQFIIKFNGLEANLNTLLINDIKKFTTNDDTTNIYLKRVIKSLNL